MTPSGVAARTPAGAKASSEEGHHAIRGKAAREAIMARLLGWPQAVELASVVADFYGDRLEYYESNALKSFPAIPWVQKYGYPLRWRAWSTCILSRAQPTPRGILTI